MTFNQDCSLNASSADQVAEELVKVVSKSVGSIRINGGQETLEWDDLEPLGLTKLGVDSIDINGLPAGNESMWTSDLSWFARKCDPGIVRRAVTEKEPKAPAYRKNVEAKANGEAVEIWLVLAISGISGSTFNGIHETTLESDYETSFDRVFIVEVLDQTVHELKVHNGSSNPHAHPHHSPLRSL